jgi:hypothetical protein
VRLAAAALLAATGIAHAAPPVAFIADLRGNATIEGDGKLNFLAEIEPGTRLLLGSGATASVTYASTGAEFTITGPGEFLVAASEVKAEKGAAPKKRSVMALPDPTVVSQVSQSATASLRMRSLSPGAAKGELEYPVDTRVATLQPVMRLREGVPAGAALTVRDEGGKEVWKGAARADGTKPGVKLAPATRYTWTVMTAQGLSEARFETLPAEAIARAEKSRLAAHTFTERLMHAMLLQELGAAQEARHAWADLARDRPDLPELAALAR